MPKITAILFPGYLSVLANDLILNETFYAALFYCVCTLIKLHWDNLHSSFPNILYSYRIPDTFSHCYFVKKRRYLILFMPKTINLPMNIVTFTDLVPVINT